MRLAKTMLMMLTTCLTLVLFVNPEAIVAKEPPTTLSGTVFSLNPMGKASVTVFDVSGNKTETIANEKGIYTVNVTGMTAPLLIYALEAGCSNFSDESQFRGKSVAAMVSAITSNVKNIANVNPLSDRVVSDVAKTIGYKGPVGLILSGKTDGVKNETLTAKTNEVRLLVLQALKDAGVANAETWDPVTSIQSKNVEKTLELIRHNRSYDTSTGVVADTLLLDISFRPLSPNDVLNFARVRKEKADLKNKKMVHLYIAGDSTCSYYESERAPRSGWGQVLGTKFKDDAPVMVINAAQSGRSSRTFINEGWLRMIEESILPGDYLMIQFGHNDEKGGSLTPAARDKFDIANTATYPNDASGQIQEDEGMSFQRWLEKYIKAAQDKKAFPILLTPTTRVKTDKDKKTGLFPINRSTHINDSSNSGAKYLGDFSQTIRDTAKANNVALIDIDTKSIAMANSAGEPGWKSLWLAVDPAQYPFYKAGTTGNIDLPDGTHFQFNGASKICDLVIEGMRENPSLDALAKWAK